MNSPKGAMLGLRYVVPEFCLSRRKEAPANKQARVIGRSEGNVGLEVVTDRTVSVTRR